MGTGALSSRWCLFKLDFSHKPFSTPGKWLPQRTLTVALSTAPHWRIAIGSGVPPPSECQVPSRIFQGKLPGGLVFRALALRGEWPCKSCNPIVTFPRSSESYKNVLTYEPLKKIDEWMLRDPFPSCSSPPITLSLPPGGGGHVPPRSAASGSLRCS